MTGLAIQEIIVVLTKTELHILAGKNKVEFFKPLQEVRCRPHSRSCLLTLVVAMPA